MTNNGFAQRCSPALLVAMVALVALVASSARVGLAGAGMQRVVVLLVVAPLVEESLFRAGLHEFLLRRLQPPVIANLCVALAFASAHAAARAEVASLLLAVPALLVGAAYQRWRSVRLCVVLHASMNALWLDFVPLRALPGASC